MVEEMAPETLADKVERDEDVQVVDVRTPAGFRRGHVPGALNLPFPRLPQEVESVEWGEEIVCICPHGKSSRQAARLIESFEGVDADATVANLEGGYEDYEGELATGE